MTTFTKSEPTNSRLWKKVLLALSAACSLAAPAWATLPSTSAGNLTIINGGTNTTTGTSGSTLTVNTGGANNVVLSWANFWDNTTNGGTSAPGDVINYQLPSSTSSILNQVTGNTAATVINGTIMSNGRVFIVNPKGLEVGSSGVVNTAGFYASTYLEPLAYFESNGTLAVFNGGPNADVSSTIQTDSGASIITTGGTGDIRFAAFNINIDNTLDGNVWLYGNGGTVTLGNASLTNLITAASVTPGVATVIGNMWASNNGGTINIAAAQNASIQGNLTLAGTGTGATAINLSGTGGAGATSASTVISGNLSATSNGGAINLADVGSGGGASGSTSVQGNLTVAAGSGVVTLTTNSGTATVNGNATIASSTSIGNAGGAGLFSVASPGTTTTITGGTTAAVAINKGDFASIGGTAASFLVTDPTTHTLGLGTAAVIGNYTVNAAAVTGTGTATVGGNYSLTATTGNLALPAAVVTGTYTAVASAGNITSSGAVSSTGAISLTAGASNGKINFTGSGNETFSTLSVPAGGAVTLSSTGNVTLNTAATTIPTLSVTSTGGNVTDTGETGALTVTKGTVSATGTVTLGATVADAFGTLSLVSGTGGATVTNAAPLTIGTGTNVAGPATITVSGAGNGLTFGASTSDTIAIGGAATLLVAGNIATVSDNFSINGAVSATATTGNVSLGTTDTGSTYNFGTVTATANGGAGTVTVDESNATNLGAISAATLNVSSGAGITGTSGIVTASTVNLTAGTASAPGDIVLGSTSKIAAIVGPINIAQAGNVTLVDGAAANVTINTASATNAFKALNATMTNAAGGLTVAFGSKSGFSGLSFNTAGGGVTFGTSGSPDTVPVTLTNAVTASSGNSVDIEDTGGITLGSGINLANTGTTTFATNTSGSISDVGNGGIQIYGPVTFSSAGAINITNNNNSLGAVTLTQTGSSNNANIVYTEMSTANIAGITLANTASTGTVSVTSLQGDVIQSGALTLGTKVAGVSFAAPTGAVTLTNAGNIIGNTTANALGTVPVSIRSANAASLTNGADTLLGNIAVTGATAGAGLTVNTSGTANLTISQAAGSTIYTYYSPTFQTQGGAVTLTNTGNNFGGIVVNTTNGVAAGANVAITEFGTSNYTTVNTGTGGTFTATSTNGDIIDNSSSVITVGGKTTLKSNNITLTKGVDTFGGAAGVLITAAGNVALTDATSTTLLDGTNIAGSLTLTDPAGGVISDSGTTATITVGGTATFSGGTLNLLGNNSSYGPAVFKLAGAGASVFTENATTNLGGGSTVAGYLTINSGGNVINSGPSAFNGGLRLNAQGSIVLSVPINVANVNGGLTVDAIAGPTDLHVESLSVNLAGHAPTNLGNQTNYTGPNP